MTSSNSQERLQRSPNTDQIKQLRRLAFLLDNSIPIPFTQYRMGIDPILGLLGIVGGTGDLFGGALGAYIIVQAARMGVPAEVIWPMVRNMALDALIGLVPGLGDVLDVAWKANARNIKLLDGYFESNPIHRKNSPWFIVGITLLLVCLILGFALALILILRAIF